MTEFKLEIATKGIHEPYLEWKVHAAESNVNDIEECVRDIVQRVISPKKGTDGQERSNNGDKNMA